MQIVPKIKIKLKNYITIPNEKKIAKQMGTKKKKKSNKARKQDKITRSLYIPCSSRIWKCFFIGTNRYNKQ